MSFEERERKYLVSRIPDDRGVGQSIRQGYLSADGEVAVRIRSIGSGDTATHLLTVKGGHGAVRVEVEWTITREEFDALWPLTVDRRITKRRYRITIRDHVADDVADHVADHVVDHVADHVAELDIFEGDLHGLALVEVEFGSDHAMAVFRAPDWFGSEVTDDSRYSNAALAISGAPPDAR